MFRPIDHQRYRLPQYVVCLKSSVNHHHQHPQLRLLNLSQTNGGNDIVRRKAGLSRQLWWSGAFGLAWTVCRTGDSKGGPKHLWCLFRSYTVVCPIYGRLTTLVVSLQELDGCLSHLWEIHNTCGVSTGDTCLYPRLWETQNTGDISTGATRLFVPSMGDPQHLWCLYRRYTPVSPPVGDPKHWWYLYRSSTPVSPI
jgi:hypothetical protein